MAISPIYIGIDISKDFLDVFDPRDGCSRRHANAPEAIQILKAHWRGAGVFVCFESSGVCTEDLVACLEEDGIDYACFNPERVRSFARALGHLAKTDAIDAKVISLYAAAASPEPQSAPDEAQKMLKTLTLRRDQLVNMRAREKNHRAATKNMAIHNMIDTHTGQLDADIARIQKAIDECIQSDPDLAARAALMRSIPGVGAVTTALMLASMPEAGKLDSKEIAALAGLAPMNRDSGRTSGKRRIQSGRLYRPSVFCSG